MICFDIMPSLRRNLSGARKCVKKMHNCQFYYTSAKSTDIDKIQGLTNGADDYVKTI